MHGLIFGQAIENELPYSGDVRWGASEFLDGEKVTAGADQLAKATVTVEVLGATKGPKITILKYKNKTGYRKRQGHRQKLTRLKVTAIA